MSGVSAFAGPIFVGCATDRKFVMPTGAMLSSLEEVGDLPHCTIVVADFGLDDEDRARLRASAGKLGGGMRFVAIDRDSPKIVALPPFDFPLPLLGRLIIPGELEGNGGRLLLLDSDVVVNTSLRPLVEMDLQGRPLAAVQDPLLAIEYHHHGKRSGSPYFNAGVMLLDLEKFNAMSGGAEAMRRLANPVPRLPYLDQCALNEVFDGQWVELERRWNFFQTGQDRSYARPDYDAACIIHFAGGKPWDGYVHPAAPIWNHHASAAERKINLWRARMNRQPVDASFVAMQYRVLLGRELEHESIAAEREVLTAYSATAALIASDEFRHAVLEPLRQNRLPPKTRFVEPLTQVDRLWACEKLPILPETARKVRSSTTWLALLTALITDQRFKRCLGDDPGATPSAH